MRFSALPLLFAGAGLVSAVPIRVVVVSSSVQELSPIRFGHAVPSVKNPPPMMATGRRPCGKGMRKSSGMMREKAIELSNAFRQALGMPLIETHAVRPVHEDNSATAASRVSVSIDDGRVHIMPVSHHGMHPHFREHIHGHREQSFMSRVNRALLSLGPWEGRAVAFVLGCGLGVLLRMFWVLAVVVLRTIRSGSNDNEDNEYIEVDTTDAELIFVAPPQYTYTDSKDAVKVVEPTTPAQQ